MKRILVALVCAALASAAAADTPTAFSQLRQEYPQIDDAIAAAPNSDLNGTLNRLSALYNRSPIDTAAADAGAQNLLPANFSKNLEATLLDLAEDIGKNDIEGLSPEQKLTLLQVVNIYGLGRPLELWQSNPPTKCSDFGGIDLYSTCVGTTEYPCPACVENDVPAMDAIDGVFSGAKALYTAYRNSLTPTERLQTDLDGNLLAPEPSSLKPGTIIGATTTMLTIKGVESIDD